jgi:hypothetical protein
MWPFPRVSAALAKAKFSSWSAASRRNIATMNIKTLVADFATQLSALIQSQVTERARAAVLSAFDGPARRAPGRPPKMAAAIAEAPVSKPARKKARKKAPPQLCPVPGCKNMAAPIFGMVCAKHKDMPKAKIKAFREARRAKKLGLPAPKAAKRRLVKKAASKKAPPKNRARKKVMREAGKPAARVQPAAATTPAAA